MKSTPKPRAKQPALRTESYFQERAARAIPGEAKRILKKAGRGKPPMPGDEIKEPLPAAPERNPLPRSPRSNMKSTSAEYA